jgi:hypothetical protein
LTVYDSHGLKVLGQNECLALLRSTPIGRIVFTHQAMPAVEPVNYLVDGDFVVLRTSPGAKLSMAAKGAVVAFQADHIDADEHTGWSVTVVGHAEQVRDEAELTRLRRLPLRPWAPGDHAYFIRIAIELVSGRRLPDGRAPALGGATRETAAVNGAMGEAVARPGGRR